MFIFRKRMISWYLRKQETIESKAIKLDVQGHKKSPSSFVIVDYFLANTDNIKRLSSTCAAVNNYSPVIWSQYWRHLRLNVLSSAALPCLRSQTRWLAANVVFGITAWCRSSLLERINNGLGAAGLSEWIRREGNGNCHLTRDIY